MVHPFVWCVKVLPVAYIQCLMYLEFRILIWWRTISVNNMAINLLQLNSLRYDLQSGASEIMGKHEDSATCIEYSPETSK